MASRGSSTRRLGILTRFDDAYTAFLPSEILELEDLINHPYIREHELQRFFEQHPNVFRLLEYRDVYPQVYLTREADGDLIPDFMLVDAQLQKAMILDLKLPGKRIVVGGTDRRRISAPLEEAKSQLSRYRDWFENPNNRS